MKRVQLEIWKWSDFLFLVVTKPEKLSIEDFNEYSKTYFYIFKLIIPAGIHVYYACLLSIYKNKVSNQKINI